MSDLAGMYQEIILDHSRRRVGAGELAEFDAERFERNPSCGDELRLRVRLDRSGTEPTLAEIGWVGDGCSISLASVSMLVEQLRGRTVTEAFAAVEAMRTMMRSRGQVSYDEDSPEAELIGDAVAFEGTAKYVMRVKCAMLSWVALETALREATA